LYYASLLCSVSESLCLKEAPIGECFLTRPARPEGEMI
jgi:hypothetical protein